MWSLTSTFLPGSVSHCVRFFAYLRRVLVPLPPLGTPQPPRRFRRTHIHRLSHEVQHLQARLGDHSPSLASEQPECDLGRRLPAHGGSNLKDGTDQGGLLIEVRPIFNGACLQVDLQLCEDVFTLPTHVVTT